VASTDINGDPILILTKQDALTIKDQFITVLDVFGELEDDELETYEKIARFLQNV
jgi:hypothetical protein